MQMQQHLYRRHRLQCSLYSIAMLSSVVVAVRRRLLLLIEAITSIQPERQNKTFQFACNQQPPQQAII